MSAADGFVDVGNAPAGPATHLIAERAEPAQPRRSYRAGARRGIGWGVDVPHWPHLDRPVDSVEVDDQRGMVDVAGPTMFTPRRQPLVDLAAEPHAMAARTYRQPVEVNPRLVPGRHDTTVTPARDRR